MEDLKYTVIKTEEQYYEYCRILEELDFSNAGDEHEDEIELLLLLIKTWDDENSELRELDPVEIIRSLMKDHGLNQNDVAEIAGVGKSLVSEILNYKRGMSKEVIRKFSDYFKIRQEALNREYPLAGVQNLKAS